MSGDGVSLPTTIAQMGNVAKAQAKGQQGTQQVAPFSDQLDKEKELKVRRVKETDKTEQGRINPDDKKEKDRRRRRRMRRKARTAQRQQTADEQHEQDPRDDTSAGLENVGGLIDTRV